jgi:aspartyl/asparaginyl-tRNA synthetase
VFKVKYFEREAYLAQSPQLAKQMAIIGDMERVFEIGPVFRAERAHTARHLTEFTGLDIEMQIYQHYHEILDVIELVFETIFEGLNKQYHHELTVSTFQKK